MSFNVTIDNINIVFYLCGMSRAIEFLEAHQSPTPSRWREDAQWRRDNDYWLKYSRYITLQVMRAMDEQSVTQVELAKRMAARSSMFLIF